MKKIFIGLIAFALVIFIAGATALMTFDADKYRPQLVALLSQKTGRTFKLSGPISLGLTVHGATLTLQDAAIANPSWASRPNMAGVGKFELRIAFLPLLRHQLTITELQITNADILLETSADNQHNWDMPVAEQGKVEAKTSSTRSTPSITLVANQVLIADSQLALRGKDGKISVFKTKIMTYGLEEIGITIHYNGDYNGAPIALDFKTGARDLLFNQAWPFDADMTYADYDIRAKGKANLISKTAIVSDYSISAGQSDIHGQLAFNWNGARPVLKGAVVSNQLNPADFKPASPDAGQPERAPSPGLVQVFSDDPLPFDSLKATDAAIEVNVAALAMGGAVLNNVISKIDLMNGHFEAPFKAGLGKSIVGGSIKIDADAKPPQITAAFSGLGLDLADLLALAHAPAFLSGNANADMTLSTSGYSLHNLAGNANGKIGIVAEGGTVLSANAEGLSSSLMKLFDPTGSNNSLNCLTARFNITNGVVQDNGILLDSSATTIAGQGGFNLGLETIDLTLHAKPKIVNISGVLPPLEIGGTFSSPSFHIDSTALLQNVAGILASGSLSNVTSNPHVPEVTGPPGVNACIYTLDHPSAAKTSAQSSSVLVPGVTGQIQKLKNSGGDLLKGLLGQ